MHIRHRFIHSTLRVCKPATHRPGTRDIAGKTKALTACVHQQKRAIAQFLSGVGMNAS